MTTTTATQAADALQKLCSAKDGLYPYIDHLYNESANSGGVAQGLETALSVISTQYEIISNYLDEKEQQESPS
jgi:hypothetical protein